MNTKRFLMFAASLSVVFHYATAAIDKFPINAAPKAAQEDVDLDIQGLSLISIPADTTAARVERDVVIADLFSQAENIVEVEPEELAESQATVAPPPVVPVEISDEERSRQAVAAIKNRAVRIVVSDNGVFINQRFYARFASVDNLAVRDESGKEFVPMLLGWREDRMELQLGDTVFFIHPSGG